MVCWSISDFCVKREKYYHYYYYYCFAVNMSNWFFHSFSGDIQDPPGQGPVQPAVGDAASAGGLD